MNSLLVSVSGYTKTNHDLFVRQPATKSAEWHQWKTLAIQHRCKSPSYDRNPLLDSSQRDFFLHHLHTHIPDRSRGIASRSRWWEASTIPHSVPLQLDRQSDIRVDLFHPVHVLRNNSALGIRVRLLVLQSLLHANRSIHLSATCCSETRIGENAERYGKDRFWF